jgi:hypothetical protein
MLSLHLLLFITFRNQTQSAYAFTDPNELDDEGENMTTNSNPDSVTSKKQTTGAGDEDTQSGFTGDDRPAKRQKTQIEVGDSNDGDGSDDSFTQSWTFDAQDEQTEADIERINPESKQVASERKSPSLLD